MDLTTPRQLGRLLRDRRQRASLTQAGLADRLRLGRQWVSEAEAGSPGTTIGPLLRALHAVGVTLTVMRAAPDPEAHAVVVPDVDAILKAARRAPAPARRPRRAVRKR